MTAPLVQLSDVLEIQNGFAFKSAQFNAEGRGVPLIRIRDIQSSNTECYYDGEYREEFLVKRGEYIIGMDGDFVCAQWSGEPALLNQRVCRLRNFSPNVLPEFIFFVLQKELEKIHNTTAFVTVKHISSKQIAAICIPLPPLEEQRRVVRFLYTATKIERHAEAARAKAHAIIAALFLDTFGDPATNPKGWPVIKLEEAISFGPQNGLYRPATDYGSGVRILRIDSFDDGTIGDQVALKRLRLDKSTVEKFLLREGDIVVNRVNSPPQLGKSAVMPHLSEPVVFESNMMRFRVNESVLIPSVLGVALQLESVRRALTRNAKHAINQSSINQGDVMGIELPKPPAALQASFAEQVQRLETLTTNLAAAAAKAGAMAAALSAEVFGA